jgi:hypothetical protein
MSSCHVMFSHIVLVVAKQCHHLTEILWIIVVDEGLNSYGINATTVLVVL